MSQTERECRIALSDACIHFCYDERQAGRYYGRPTQHPCYKVALYLNNMLLGSRFPSP